MVSCWFIFYAHVSVGSSEEWLYDVFMRIGQYQIEEWAVVTESLTCDGLWSIEYLTQPDLTRGRHGELGPGPFWQHHVFP